MGSWVTHNESFHCGWMGWRGVMRWREETPQGQMGAQTDKNNGRMDGRVEKVGFSFTLTSFLDVCHHFGELLRRFCQCKSFSWFVYVPSLSCVYKGWPPGGRQANYPPERRPAKSGLWNDWAFCLCRPCQTNKNKSRQLLVIPKKKGL